MSDDATELFDGVADEERAASADDATDHVEAGDEAQALPTMIGEVDVSVFDEQFREFLSGQDTEIGEAAARAARRQYDEIKRNQTRVHQELAEERRKLQADIQHAEFGKSIAGNPELMARVLAVGGQSSEEEERMERIPIGDIDFSTEEGERQLVETMLTMPSAQKLIKQMVAETAKEQAQTMLSSDPVLQGQRLRAAATSARAQLEQQGTKFTNEEWSAVTNHWASEKGGVQEALASDANSALREMLSLGKLASQYSHPTNAPRTARPTSAPSPSGGSSTPLRVQKPWEKDKRKMTLSEIRDFGGGTKPGDLERALEQARKKGSLFS